MIRARAVRTARRGSPDKGLPPPALVDKSSELRSFAKRSFLQARGTDPDWKTERDLHTQTQLLY
eukprot:1145413-Pelagomonas_calceolata.AAC.3